MCGVCSSDMAVVFKGGEEGGSPQEGPLWLFLVPNSAAYP